MKTEIPTSGFFFDPIKHYYYLDGKKLTGVTTILGTIAKPQLIPWAARMAVEHIEREVAILVSDSGDNWMTVLSQKWSEILTTAKSAHAKKRDTRATEGTDTHAEVEKYVRMMIDQSGGVAQPEPEMENIQPFIGWACKNNVKFLLSEKRVFSKEHFYAGTLDIVLEKDGKTLIADIKTGKAIYPTYYYQMAGYQICLEEMGEKIDGAVVLRLGEDGSFEDQYRFDFATDKSAFMGALAIYRANATYGA